MNVRFLAHFLACKKCFINEIYVINVCVRAQLLQSCLTLCDPMDFSPPGSSVHGDSPGKNTGVGCHVLLQGILLLSKDTFVSVLLANNVCMSAK